jgi:hypothetical protein
MSLEVFVQLPTCRRNATGPFALVPVVLIFNYFSICMY